MAKETKKEYYEGVGRRKTAVARVRIVETKEKGKVMVGKKTVKEYFEIKPFVSAVTAPLEATGTKDQFQISIKVRGGGKRGQAEAAQLGLSRALVKFDGEWQKTLRDLDYLKRDPRKKERKKAGLKKARRSPQWSKR